MNIAFEPFLIVLPLALVGIWIALYSARKAPSVRLDVHLHIEEKAPQRPATRPTLTIKRPSYVVVDPQRSMSDTLTMIEDSLSEILAVTREWRP